MSKPEGSDWQISPNLPPYRRRDAGDVGSLIAGQKQNGARSFVDRALALHQAAVDGLVDNLLVPSLFVGAGRLGVVGNASRGRPAPWR